MQNFFVVFMKHLFNPFNCLIHLSENPMQNKLYLFVLFDLGILVTATKDKNNKYPYNPTTLVLLSEFLKLIVASVLHVKE